MIQIMAGGCLIITLSFGAFGQSTSSGPAFEVASVRLHAPRGGQVALSTSGPRLNAEAKTVAGLIMYAFNLQSYQVPDTPALAPFGDMFYDIAAKAEGTAIPSAEDFRLMLQGLLVNRFKLQVHREKRELPIYALVVGRNGPKLRESIPGSDPTVRYAFSGRNYDVTMPKATMDDLVRAIENSLVDRPVVNKTELSGAWEVKITYTPNTRSNRGSSDPDDISIFTAVNKLGLRLDAEKAMTDVLVVDQVEKPSAN